MPIVSSVTKTYASTMQFPAMLCGATFATVPGRLDTRSSCLTVKSRTAACAKRSHPANRLAETHSSEVCERVAEGIERTRPQLGEESTAERVESAGCATDAPVGWKSDEYHSAYCPGVYEAGRGERAPYSEKMHCETVGSASPGSLDEGVSIRLASARSFTPLARRRVYSLSTVWPMACAVRFGEGDDGDMSGSEIASTMCGRTNEGVA